MTSKRRGIYLAARRMLVGGILVLELAVGLVSAQSLGDIAKKEEARRKAVKESGKVYTNDNLKSEPTLPQATTPPPSNTSPSSTEPNSQSGGTQAAAEPKKDESYWRKRLQTERDAIDKAKTYSDALQSRINALTTDFANRADPAQRDVVAADRQKAMTELERLKQEIQQRTKALADIQEEARRAGAPPAWLR